MSNVNLEEEAPSRVTSLLREADARIQEYLQQQRGHGLGFVASDFQLVNRALERIAAEDLAHGPLFCEWGSGFGVVTMLAHLYGFDACGIEIQADLVQAAEELAAVAGCDVRFAHGSIVTTEAEDLIDTTHKSWWHTTGTTAYEDLDLAPADFDAFFGYPWPGEEDLFDALFMRYASIGALLLTYHDGDGVLVQRKTHPTDVPAVIGWY